jgi:seryl-tRNA synthetase
MSAAGGIHSIRVARAELDGELGEVAGKLAYFAGAGVVGVRRPTPGLLEIDLDPGTSAEARAAIERDVLALVARLAAGYRPLPGRTLFERRAAAPALGIGAEALTTRLVEAGWARRQGPGAYAFGPRFVALVEAIDARLRRLAGAALGATERAFPPLIEADALHRAGYLASFPQSVTFVSHLPARLDAIERFREANARADRFVLPAEAAPEAPVECLPPAVCYHRFRELAGSTLDAGSMITARGACFRYEARGNMRDLGRLWCFQMREVVYTGDEPFVRDAAARAARELEALVAELDLTASCEAAADPFFVDVFAEKRWAQRAGERKLELRLPLGEGETLAAASINAHEDFFGRAFAVRRADGAPITSGCTAFGLERLALAFLAQHGLDERGWPGGVVASMEQRAHAGR